jgi:hypothetical protein
VGAEDWERLRDKLLERGRIPDMVRVCEVGKVAIPRERLLERADRALVTKDVDLVLDLYELAEADRGRWEKLLDILIEMPERKRQAVTIADRYLIDRAEPAPARVRAGSATIKAVK